MVPIARNRSSWPCPSLKHSKLMSFKLVAKLSIEADSPTLLPNRKPDKGLPLSLIAVNRGNKHSEAIQKESQSNWRHSRVTSRVENHLCIPKNKDPQLLKKRLWLIVGVILQKKRLKSTSTQKFTSNPKIHNFWMKQSFPKNPVRSDTELVMNDPSQK